MAEDELYRYVSRPEIGQVLTPAGVNPDFLVLEVGDWPGGSLSAMRCAFPESVDGGIDLALPIQCEQHRRTYWWCLNAATVWCDGGPPDYAWHPVSLAEAE